MCMSHPCVFCAAYLSHNYSFMFFFFVSLLLSFLLISLVDITNCCTRYLHCYCRQLSQFIVGMKTQSFRYLWRFLLGQSFRWMLHGWWIVPHICMEHVRLTSKCFALGYIAHWPRTWRRLLPIVKHLIFQLCWLHIFLRYGFLFIVVVVVLL